ncbi:hypothetical protein V6N13_026056 [Hibiscus sabdariffa]|uniref:Uncharacterized protein n=2 Tax=Hibiscus sabdariffa TaxID=183260 RepID=A0ABR1ZBA9_9ROSI
MEVEIKCLFCQGGFIEEMSNGTRYGAQDMYFDFHGSDTNLDRELESIMRSSIRSSATILQLLQGICDGMASEEIRPTKLNPLIFHLC